MLLAKRSSGNAFAYISSPRRLGAYHSMLAAGAWCGVGALLLQNLVDLALEIPAVCISMAAVLGSLWSDRNSARACEAWKRPGLVAPYKARCFAVGIAPDVCMTGSEAPAMVGTPCIAGIAAWVPIALVLVPELAVVVDMPIEGVVAALAAADGLVWVTLIRTTSSTTAPAAAVISIAALR